MRTSITISAVILFIVWFDKTLTSRMKGLSAEG